MKLLQIAATIVATLLVVAPESSTQDLSDLSKGLNYIHPGRRGEQVPAKLDASPLPFHNSGTLVCGMCHIMHASEQHAHDSAFAPDPYGAFPRSYLPGKKLLKADDPVALCLGCHDGVPGAPDVVGADVNGLTERSAGMFELPGVDNPRGHKLDYNIPHGSDWDLCMRCHFGGTFATATVSCIDCHNPHGNRKVRNLQWASYPGGEPDFGLYVNPGVGGIAKYERANVAYGTDDGITVREVTNMCLDCHHVVSGTYTDPKGNGIHNLHPTYDSERGTPNHISQGDADHTTDGAHWEGGTGDGFIGTARLRYVTRGATDYNNALAIDASTNGVLCLSCHNAHGSDRAFGLRWDPAIGPGGKGCNHCHNISGT